MRIEIKEKLLAEYRKIKFPKETTAIKYWYQYEKVNINIYFDSFDNNNPNLSIVLVYNKSYYYTSLNINNTTVSKEYLVKIPQNILERILDRNNMLDAFFKSIEDHISFNNAKYINYEKDLIFSNTIKYCQKSKRNDLPFLYGIRKVPMSNEMFKILNKTMSIDENVLKKIQEQKMTIVRTSEVSKRKKLTIILDGILNL